MNRLIQKMKDSYKDIVQYATAVVLVLSGIVLAFFSFFLYADVQDGVLWYIAQALCFAGAVFGLQIYIRSKVGEAATDIFQRLQDERIRDHAPNENKTPGTKER